MSGMEDPIQPIAPRKMSTFVLCQTVFLFLRHLEIPNVENLLPEVSNHPSAPGECFSRGVKKQALKKQGEVEMMELNAG